MNIYDMFFSIFRHISTIFFDKKIPPFSHEEVVIFIYRGQKCFSINTREKVVRGMLDAYEEFLEWLRRWLS